MTDPKSWMWAEACDLLMRADRLHRQFFQLGRSRQRPVWEPPVDIFETERDLWIQVALPGVAPEHIEVAIEGSVITVRAQRPMPGEARAAVIHRLEIPYGYLERRIELPPRLYELHRRSLDNGCLVLGLRKLP